jgi:hypothetical protein
MSDTEENKEQSAAVITEDAIIEIDVFVDSDDSVVYVKFSNFEELEDAESYADYLVENLPLMLFQSRTIH